MVWKRDESAKMSPITVAMMACLFVLVVVAAKSTMLSGGGWGG